MKIIMLLITTGLGVFINTVNPFLGFLFILVSVGITSSIIKETLQHYTEYKNSLKKL